MGSVDKRVGMLLFVFFGSAFLYARGFPTLAATYVYIINVLGLFLSAILVLVSFIKDIKGKTVVVQKKSREEWIRIGITVTSIILYALLLRVIGYVLATIIYFVAMILYLHLGRKNTRYCILTLIGSTAVAFTLYFIFNRLLFIMLP